MTTTQRQIIWAAGVMQCNLVVHKNYVYHLLLLFTY